VSGNFPTNSTVSVFRPDGTSPTGWPKTLSDEVFRQFNAPVIGDVDGDSFPDIVMGFENVSEGFEKLYAWDRRGRAMPGWPRLLRYIYGYGITGSPVLADMDRNGLLDCAISSNAYWMYSTDIHVWNLGVPYMPEHLPWPVFRANPQMTASLRPVATGMQEGRGGEHSAMNRGPTIVRGVLFLPPSPFPLPEGQGSGVSGRAVLLDISGRHVMNLHPGANDLRHLAPGVYFVWPGAQAQAVSRLVVVR
jgi:hypothetical protein